MAITRVLLQTMDNMFSLFISGLEPHLEVTKRNYLIHFDRSTSN